MVKVARKKSVKPVGKSRVKKADGASIVLETKDVPTADLQPYHENPNLGNPEKTAESLKENGQYRAIVVNIGTHTGRPYEILAGNHTWMGMKKLRHPTIRCDLVDVDDDKAEAVMLADNGSRDGSKYDDTVLSQILSNRKDRLGTLVGTTIADGTLESLVKNMTTDENANVDKIEDAPDGLEGVEDLNNNVIFDSDLDYDIPALLLDMIPEEPPPNLEVWAGHEVDGKDLIGEEAWAEKTWLSVWHTGCRGINWKKSIACFYTDDFHFDPVYVDPAKNTKKILNLGMEYAFMPNYTIYSEMPVALWVYAAYRSYFVARYFQEAGIKVIPDIQIGGSDAVLDVSLIGIPQGCGTVAAQVQMARGKADRIRRNARMLKEAENRLGFKNIILYGHTDADEVADRAGFDCNVIRVANRTSRRREYLNSGATINTQKVTKTKKRKKEEE